MVCRCPRGSSPPGQLALPHAGHRLGGLAAGDSRKCHEAEGALGMTRTQKKLIKELSGGSQAAGQSVHGTTAPRTFNHDRPSKRLLWEDDGQTTLVPNFYWKQVAFEPCHAQIISQQVCQCSNTFITLSLIQMSSEENKASSSR